MWTFDIAHALSIQTIAIKSNIGHRICIPENVIHIINNDSMISLEYIFRENYVQVNVILRDHRRRLACLLVGFSTLGRQNIIVPKYDTAGALRNFGFINNTLIHQNKKCGDGPVQMTNCIVHRAL